jgi:hypothetical protein
MFKIALALVASATVAHVDAKPDCALPLAMTKEVALGIYNAVVNGQESPRRRRNYEIKIDDEGDNWSVYQMPKGGNSTKYFTDKDGRKMEIVTVIAGGGGLEMIIDKCTAAISSAHFSR